jgi:murein DD-endopeptidase MepM/ murein hydrolase activator NlpD
MGLLVGRCFDNTDIARLRSSTTSGEIPIRTSDAQLEPLGPPRPPGGVGEGCPGNECQGPWRGRVLGPGPGACRGGAPSTGRPAVHNFPGESLRIRRTGKHPGMTRFRLSIVALLLLTTLVGPGARDRAFAAPIPGGVRSAPGAYVAPVTGAIRILVAFSPPATRYGAGHRGVDLALGPGASVLAAGAGVVRFAGLVAGRGVVVVDHRDGVSTEYEPVSAAVGVGQRVKAGQRIGRLQGLHPPCSPQSCLHWGARSGDAYLDPQSLLRPLGPVRLLPWSGPP